ncbi:MAG: outer membrane beta-barrel protein [Nitrospirota bacterium]
MKSVRSRIGIGLGMCAMVSLLGGNAVLAADAESTWKAMGFKISGAVEASYTQNFNNPNTNVNQLRIFDTQANSFVPQVAQIVFEKTAVASGSTADRVGFRARLNFGAQSRFSRARTNFQPGTDNNELDFQELYAEYIAPVGNGLKIQAGKINTLIGYEGINSWENPNFSRSFMFGLSQAFTTTGIRFTYPINSWATAAIGLINGWDNIEDNNRGKSFEWKVDLTPHEKFGIAFFGSYGAEQSNGNANLAVAGAGTCAPLGATGAGCDPSGKRTVVGSIITIKPTANDTLIIEPYYGNEGNASGVSASQNARWNGLITYFIHDFNDQQQPHAFSLRARGEIWEDAGGVRACAGGINFNGGTNTCANSGTGQAFGIGTGIQPAIGGQALGTAQTLWEGTVTLQYKPAPSLITRAEFRYDKSNKNNFLQGNQAVNNQQTLAFSVVYLF